MSSSPTNAGRHVCGTASTRDAHGRMAAAWIRDSLDAGLRVTWAARDEAFVRGWLDREGVDHREAEHSGRLQIMPPGGLLALDSIEDIPGQIAAARETVRQALDDGFTGVSVGVEASDALAVMRDVPTQLAYEAAWEEFTREHPLWLLCLYGPTSRHEHIGDAIRLHPREFTDALMSARAGEGRIAVTGEVDAVNSDLVGRYLRAAAAGPAAGVDDIILDLEGLSFIDLGGARALLTLQREHADRRLRVLNPPRTLRRVLDLAGWGDALDIVEEVPR